MDTSPVDRGAVGRSWGVAAELERPRPPAGASLLEHDVVASEVEMLRTGLLHSGREEEREIAELEWKFFAKLEQAEESFYQLEKVGLAGEEIGGGAGPEGAPPGFQAVGKSFGFSSQNTRRAARVS